jgi:class I fructose-bisphosphate aldolase
MSDQLPSQLDHSAAIIRSALRSPLLGHTHSERIGIMHTPLTIDQIREHLGAEADALLSNFAPKIDKALLTTPSPSFVDDVFLPSDRNEAVIGNLERLFGTGRLANTGYLSILPVDQGVEHSGGSAFAANPMYFDPENIVRLAIEGGCNAVASTFGVLGMVAGRYADQIPFIVKINHNELLSFPNKHDQTMYGKVEQAARMGAVAVGATIYFGSPESRRQIEEVALAFARAHELGLATILWCYVRNSGFTVDGVNYESAADITGQANHLGATIQADIVKQKLPTMNGGYKAMNTGGSSYGKLDERIYTELSSDNIIDLTRYQVLNGFAGKVGLISSGGPSSDNDFQDAVRTAVINKRAGGMGVIAGRKAFQRPFDEGVALLQTIQDVYLCREVSIL